MTRQAVSQLALIELTMPQIDNLEWVFEKKLAKYRYWSIYGQMGAQASTQPSNGSRLERLLLETLHPARHESLLYCFHGNLFPQSVQTVINADSLSD